VNLVRFKELAWWALEHVQVKLTEIAVHPNRRRTDVVMSLAGCGLCYDTRYAGTYSSPRRNTNTVRKRTLTYVPLCTQLGSYTKRIHNVEPATQA